jgi:hypothetical protein
MLPREKYLDPPAPDLAQWLRVVYPDDTGRREEILCTSGESDAYTNWQRRTSPDNGRTWSAPAPLRLQEQQPGGGIAFYPPGSVFDARRRVRYQGMLRFVWPGLPLYTFDWDGGDHPCQSHVFVLENEVWRMLRFEPGPESVPWQPFDAEALAANRAYPGQSLRLAPDGTVFLPLVCADRGQRLFSRGGLRLMRRDPVSGEWQSSDFVTIPPEWSTVGLEEPDVAILRDGTLLVVCRGHSTPTKPGYKWRSLSRDGGRTLEPVAPLCYDDGQPVFSPDSIHYFLRSTRNGRLYWIANILSTPPAGQGPRYPLQIAEIDEDRAAVIRRSVVCIDDRGPGEPEALQLSNFACLEDRETLDFEIYVTRLGENRDHFWQAPVYRYRFSPPPGCSA